MAAPKLSSREIGRLGEEEAERLLRREGCEILARNYHSAYGEIDLIAADGDCICFVEVKTRRAGSMVHGTQAVGAAKQRKIIATALLYLQEHPDDRQPRFDVLSIVTDGAHRVTEYQLIKGAFDNEHYAW